MYTAQAPKTQEQMLKFWEAAAVNLLITLRNNWNFYELNKHSMG